MENKEIKKTTGANLVAPKLIKANKITLGAGMSMVVNELIIVAEADIDDDAIIYLADAEGNKRQVTKEYFIAHHVTKK